MISNGVMNLSPIKHVVFSEAARVLRPGGRLALADIVSARPLKERTRRNIDLWAACVAGAIPRASYAKAIETVGLEVGPMRRKRLRVHQRSRARGVQRLRHRERLTRRTQAGVTGSCDPRI